MNKTLLIFLSLVVMYIPVLAVISQPPVKKTHSAISPTDSTEKQLSAFRTFASEYFDRVKKGDTTFLKAHTIFPIKNSSFDVFDWSLHGINITSGSFFKKLHKLFPADYMADIKKNGKYIFIPRSNEYFIVCYYTTGGVDSNVKWFFFNCNSGDDSGGTTTHCCNGCGGQPGDKYQGICQSNC